MNRFSPKRLLMNGLIIHTWHIADLDFELSLVVRDKKKLFNGGSW